MAGIVPTTLRSAQMAVAILAVAPPAGAEPRDPGLLPTGSEIRETLGYAEHKATDILGQPVRDVGLLGRDVPEPLQRASRDPYALAPSWSCADIDSEIAQLNGTLGPEPGGGEQYRESRVGKLAEAGGRAVVNSIIPYRTVVREVSGAAPAARRLQAAIDIGHERRGFLRGIYRARSCGPVENAEAPPQ